MPGKEEKKRFAQKMTEKKEKKQNTQREENIIQQMDVIPTENGTFGKKLTKRNHKDKISECRG